jgi:hypothetical protein
MAERRNLSGSSLADKLPEAIFYRQLEIKEFKNMKNQIIYRFKLVFFLMLIAGSFNLKAQSLPAAEIKLEHNALGKAPTINIQIGAKTYPFLFDTGGGITLISPAIAGEIGCQPFGKISGFNAGGTRLDFKRCDNVDLKTGNYSARLNVGVFEIMTLFGPDTKEIGGIVSLQTFENQVITIDLAGNKLIVENKNSFKEQIKNMKQLESRIGSQGGGAIIDLFVASNTPKGKIWMEFDTGNFSTLQFSPHAQEMLGINFDAPNRAKMIKPVKLDIVGFGEIDMPGRERDMIYDGMLNYDTISKMIVTINLKTGETWAKMNPAVKSEQQK